jgi:hypothetical protein
MHVFSVTPVIRSYTVFPAIFRIPLFLASPQEQQTARQHTSVDHGDDHDGERPFYSVAAKPPYNWSVPLCIFSEPNYQKTVPNKMFINFTHGGIPRQESHRSALGRQGTSLPADR